MNRAKLRNIVWMLARPRFLSSWLYLAFRRRFIAPEEPWLSQQAICFLDSVLHSDMTALEWGSGYSTAWLAERVGSLVSVEANRSWQEFISARLQKRGLSAECRFIPADSEDYLNIVEEFPVLDFALIDDARRTECVARVLPKIKPGGLLAIDNTDWIRPLSLWGVPDDWPIVHRSSNGVTETTVWQRPATD